MADIKKLDLNDPDTKSADIVAGNADALKALFPEAFTEGRIDFEALKGLLGAAVDERDEKYGLNWHGKRRARQIALTPSTGTLLPYPDESGSRKTMAPCGIAPCAQRNSTPSCSQRAHRLASERVWRRLRAPRSAPVPRRARSISFDGSRRRTLASFEISPSISASANSDNEGVITSSWLPGVIQGRIRSMTRSAPALRRNFICRLRFAVP